MHRDRKQGGGTVRSYTIGGRRCQQLPAIAKSAFVAASLGRKLHRPGRAETLWVDGRYVGVTVKTVCHAWLVNHLSLESDPETFDYCDACLIEAWPGPCVYRLFDDEGGLLYVGCTINLLNRVLAHLGGPWGSLIASHSFEVFPDQLSALLAERVAILNERPEFNKDLTDQARIPGRRPAAYAHHIDQSP